MSANPVHFDTKIAAAMNFMRQQFGTEGPIPLHQPNLGDAEKRDVNAALESGFVSSVGELVDRVEQQACDITGAAFAVATVSGTAALHTALHLVGVDTDTEVLLQPLSFVATANAVKYQNAHPVFIDIDENTLGMSAVALDQFLKHQTVRTEAGCINRTTRRKISACVPTHVFGFPVEIDRIRDLCHTYGIPLVEDAAQSLGSFVGDQHTGTFGKFGIISFNGNKITTAGGGGMILTNDEDMAGQARHLTTTAKTSHSWDGSHDQVGYNYRMPNLNAALLHAQFQRLPFFLAAKRELANRYRDFFGGLEIPLLWERPGTRANFWLMTICLTDREHRDAFLEATNQGRVMTRPPWQLLCDLPMYRVCHSQALPTARTLSDRLLSLPSGVVGASR
ncbi:MAG: LegC family aminotransferase [Gammaproteobacteria bacterium]|nr:LegC family aminotransferase [Gammaproteobacteria bacterium]